jgi:hypothetical protein
MARAHVLRGHESGCLARPGSRPGPRQPRNRVPGRLPATARWVDVMDAAYKDCQHPRSRVRTDVKTGPIENDRSRRTDRPRPMGSVQRSGLGERRPSQRRLCIARLCAPSRQPRIRRNRRSWAGLQRSRKRCCESSRKRECSPRRMAALTVPPRRCGFRVLVQTRRGPFCSS